MKAGDRRTTSVDGNISAIGDAIIQLQMDDSAQCNYFGSLFSDTTTTNIELPPQITGLQTLTNTGQYIAFTPYVDTPQSPQQTLIINGLYLTAAGVSNPPEICVNGACATGGSISTSGFHLGGSWQVSEADSTGVSQIAMPYWVDATATAGSYTLAVITAGGSSTVAFTVGDATPVITSLSPGVWNAGTTVPITINGRGFGTNPTLTVTGPGVSGSSITGASDTQITANVPIASTSPGGTATVQVQSNGYGGSGFLGSPGQPSTGSNTASIQPISIKIQLSYSGTPVASGGTVYITPTPSLPLTAVLSSSQQLTGSVVWKLSASYYGPGSYTYACSTAVTTAATATFDINAASNGRYCGGAAVLTYTYGSLTGSIGFNILGQSPTVATVKGQLGTSPWYIQQLANSESPGYQQFYSSGYPVFGAPNGFGIMMIDYHNNVYDLWTWTTNVADGEAIITSNAATGSSFWKAQVGNWLAYNVANPTETTPPPYNATEGPCEFSYNPVTRLGQHSYSDAIAIKSYNSGPPTSSSPTGAYVRFDSANGVWVFNTLGGTSPPFDYVYRVCTTSP